MILGILSIILDLFLLNIFNYHVDNVIFFPMFSLVFLICLTTIKYNYKIIIIIYMLFSLINGIIFLPLLIIFINYSINSNNTINNYLLRMLLLLILYDFLFFSFLSLSNYFLLINKLIVSIPINILYSFIVYYNFNVLKRRIK